LVVSISLPTVRGTGLADHADLSPVCTPGFTMRHDGWHGCQLNSVLAIRGRVDGHQMAGW
jgi:hypothetical protein